jgi:hypothetical protein
MLKLLFVCGVAPWANFDLSDQMPGRRGSETSPASLPWSMRETHLVRESEQRNRACGNRLAQQAVGKEPGREREDEGQMSTLQTIVAKLRAKILCISANLTFWLRAAMPSEKSER